MIRLEVSKRSVKFLKRLPKKQHGQISRKIWGLKENLLPNDSKKVEGFEGFFRVDVGEYRVVYTFTKELLYIAIIGKRNDSEVYRRLDRMVQ